VIPTETAEGVAEVAEKIVEVGFPPGVADFLFDAFKSPEFELSAPPGFVGTQTCGHIIGDLLFKMEAQFFVEMLFGARFLKQATDPVHE
jgi:hypothetical protein